MSISPCAAIHIYPSDQIIFLGEKQASLPVPVEEDLKSQMPAGWIFCQDSPLPNNSICFAYNLAWNMHQSEKLLYFGSDVLGLILSYPDSNDPYTYSEDSQMLSTRKAPIYLHLFNEGKTTHSVSGTVEGITFTNVNIHPMRRLVLLLKKPGIPKPMNQFY